MGLGCRVSPWVLGVGSGLKLVGALWGARLAERGPLA